MQDYLIKQTHECLWHFTYMQNNGLCFTKLSNGHKQEYEVLLKEARPDYAVVIDDNNQIHLVCQDDTGSIIYLNNFDKQWHKFVVLKSKTPTSYDKNFQLILINSWISLFYTIEYRGKKMLSHQILDSSVEPTVLDYIIGDYVTTMDYYNNIWVFYHSEISNAFGYRKYTWNQKEWEAFAPLPTAEGLNHYQCHIGIDNKLHIVGENSGKIFYANVDNKHTIGNGKSPILYADNNTLWCMWVANNNVQAMSSTDNGANWRSSGDFISGRTASPTLFHLAYTSYEKDLNAKYCYGYFNNDIIRLYVMNQFLQISMSPPPAKEQITGEEVKEFAKQFDPEPKSVEENKPDVEMTKLKIQISGLSDQINKSERKIDNLLEQINIMENKLENATKVNLFVNKFDVLDKKFDSLDGKFINLEKNIQMIFDSLSNDDTEQRKSFWGFK